MHSQILKRAESFVLISLAITVFSPLSYCDAPDFIWEHCDQNSGVYYDVAITPDGASVVAAGYYIIDSSSYPAVVKYSSDGQKQWTWDAGVPGGIMTDVQTYADGTIVAAGGVCPISGLPTYQMLVILDDEGNEISRFWLDFEEASGAYGFVRLPDGGFAIGGTILLYDVYTPTLTRIASDGSVLWSAEPDGVSGAIRTVLLSDQGHLVCLADPSYKAPVFLEYSLDGQLSWTYDCTGSLQSGDGDFCCFGSEGGYAVVSYRDAMAIDSYGGLLWLEQPTGYHDRELLSSSPTMDGGLILSGADGHYEFYEPYQYHSYNGWLVKLDQEGNSEWNITWDPGSGHTYFHCARQYQTGGYIVSGSDNGHAYLGRLAPESGVSHDIQPDFTADLCKNPFSSEMVISVEASEPGDFKIEVFDISGRLVEDVHEGILDSGSHTFSWHAPESNCSAVYLIRIVHDSEIRVLRAVRL